MARPLASFADLQTRPDHDTTPAFIAKSPFDPAIDLVVRVAAESEGEAEALRQTLGSVQKFIDAQEAARRKRIEMGPDLKIRIWEHRRDDEDSS